MRIIPLTQGKVAIVSDRDYTRVSKYKWCAVFDGYNWYARRRGPGGHSISLHRFILGLKRGDGIIVDHRNNDGLDNRRCNLRICTHSENLRNQRKQNVIGKSSKYKGVRKQKKGNLWQTRIRYKGKEIYLGSYEDEKRAALEYDKTATKLFGQFAHTNFSAEAKQ